MSAKILMQKKTPSINDANKRAPNAVERKVQLKLEALAVWQSK